MLTNHIAALATLAAVAQPAIAVNPHRHLHKVEKKDAVEWVTEYKTVIVTAGQEKPAPTGFFAAQQPANAAPTVTSVLYVPDSKPAPKPNTVVKQAPQQTTFSKATKETPAPSSDSGKGPFKKKGIAYNDPQLASSFGKTCDGCGWTYNWGSNPNGVDSKLSYVPMLWSPEPRFANNWHSDAQKALSNGAKALLSFNEPDNAGQANMSPEDAAAGHAKYMNQYSGKALIGSPAVTNSGQPGEGLAWLKSFFSACKNQEGGCKVDFCAVHWYSEPEYSNTLFDHIKQAHDICGDKPIWLTEFAPIGPKSKFEGFMKDVLPKLDAIDYLHGYSYFMVSNDNLMSGGGLLSALGNLYASIF